MKGKGAIFLMEVGREFTTEWFTRKSGNFPVLLRSFVYVWAHVRYSLL